MEAGGGVFTTNDKTRFGGRFDRYRSGADRRDVGGKIRKKIIGWDHAPQQAYFDELKRVSKHQIIWGANYFTMPPTRCFVVWKKLTISESFTMAMCEYAWTNFNENAKLFECAPQGTARDPRFHPTQKPVALYEWLIGRFAKDGDIILDTHVGSASSLIACRRAGHKYVGFEIDPEYYAKASARLEQETAQISLFDFGNTEQINLLDFGKEEGIYEDQH